MGTNIPIDSSQYRLQLDPKLEIADLSITI